MNHEDKNLIAQIFAERASNQNNPQQFFNSLLQQAGLPKEWIWSRQGQWSGNLNGDATSLVHWAIQQGTNPVRTEYTTLGCILEVVLEMVGVEQAQALAIRIIHYRLYRDDRLLADLAQRYGIPQPISASADCADGANSANPANTAQKTAERSPDFTWYGSEDDVELEGFLPPKTPEFIDIGLMIRAVERRRSICRIEIPISSDEVCYGTGFLIAPNLVLTNYHVMDCLDRNDADELAPRAILRFNYVTGNNNQPDKGQVFKLDAKTPILASSPTAQLDYALLKVEDKIRDAENLMPAPYELTHPARNTALHILQHPEGGVMKLGFSENGITGIYENVSRIQYVTRTKGGSSGSPCFNDAWNVVALHRAKRTKGFGSIREGVLFSAIYPQISKHLT